MASEYEPEAWESIDPWWGALVGASSTGRPTSVGLQFSNEWLSGAGTGEWADIDSWWETRVATRQEKANRILEPLWLLDEVWASSESRFDTDPLAADWTSATGKDGPLRTRQEENWSPWPAHLLRGDTGGFTGDLFGEGLDSSPRTVRREVHLPETDAPDRFADVLCEYEDRGVSIEVKIDDTNYQKTTHTASLAERHHTREWTHVLLLPRRNRSALEQSLGGAIEETLSERLRIDPQTDEVNGSVVTVLYWRDVSVAIRRRLLGGEAGPHWEASAYLFCTLIEQELLGFSPRPVVAQAASSDALVPIGPGSTLDSGFEDQSQYLEDILPVNDG